MLYFKYMLSWNKKYNISKIEEVNYNELIEKAKNKESNLNLEILDKLEEDYDNQIKKIGELDLNNLGELLKKCSYDLICEEYSLMKIFSKYSLEKNKYDRLFLVKILKILFKISEELRHRLRQKEISHKIRERTIVRCSYKFCNYGSSCDYHYKYKRCKNHHFVHNMVSADIKVLINYFLSIKDDEFSSNKDVVTSVNTILYVISHMKTELEENCIYLNRVKEDWEKFHF